MSIIDFLLPIQCIGCSIQGTYLCEPCAHSLPFPIQRCPVCRKNSLAGLTHEMCKDKTMLSGMYSLWKYEGTARNIIHSIKYHFAYDMVKECTSRALTHAYFPVDVSFATAIPSHSKRQNWRGFNPADKIAHVVALHMHWRYIPEVLVKHETDPQVQHTRQERQKNIHGAFSVNSKTTAPIDGASIVLIDDVYTTGSTMEEAARKLKQSGAKDVYGFTLCR